MIAGWPWRDFALILFVIAAFGLWPLLAPGAYLRFVRNWNDDRVRLPNETVVRLIGGIFVFAGAAFMLLPPTFG